MTKTQNNIRIAALICVDAQVIKGNGSIDAAPASPVADDFLTLRDSLGREPSEEEAALFVELYEHHLARCQQMTPFERVVAIMPRAGLTVADVVAHAQQQA